MLQAMGQISRLKSFFRSGINYSCYEEMLSCSKRQASGSLPKDILSHLISGNTDKKNAIQGTEQLFEDAVNVLGDINKLEKQALNRTPFNQNSILKMNDFVETDNIKGFFRLDSLYNEKELETIIKAEERFLNGIKKYIPEADNVVITPLGCGYFANGYKMQVIGKDGKKIFNDKVLKVYREDFFGKMWLERINRYVESLSDEKLQEVYNNEFNLFADLEFSFDKMTPLKFRKKMRKEMQDMEKSVEALQKSHGAMAEANVSEFLRFFSGHKVTPEEGIAIPSFFGLGKTKFALGEFISKETKAKRMFDFERLGVRHTDFQNKPGNGINGICIDMGGIITLLGPNGKEIILNKENIYLLKTLLNCPENQKQIVLTQIKKYLNVA